MSSAQGATFLDQLNNAFPEGIVGQNLDAIDPWVEVSADRLVSICRWLKEESPVAFDSVQCITAVDWFQSDPKKAAKVSWDPHVELVYHLWSTVSKASLVLKVKVSRWKDDVPGRLPEVPSVACVWRGADWHEREVFDLSGVCFVGHPDLRRILCPEDWEGYPLRKDYEMPLDYHGIRGR
ncbi:MAG: NADH-quinone oxidoreductase subunit C [Pirellulales bacterium]